MLDLSVEVEGLSAEIVYAGYAGGATQINSAYPPRWSGVHYLAVRNGDAVSQVVPLCTAQ